MHFSAYEPAEHTLTRDAHKLPVTSARGFPRIYVMVPLDLAGLIQPFYGGTLVFFLSFSFFCRVENRKRIKNYFFTYFFRESFLLELLSILKNFDWFDVRSELIFFRKENIFLCFGISYIIIFFSLNRRNRSILKERRLISRKCGLIFVPCDIANNCIQYL